MDFRCPLAVLVLLFAGSAPSAAQGWPTYLDETSSRLVVDPQYGIADGEEKDYAWGDVDLDGDVDLVCVRKQPWNTPGRRRNVLFMNEGIAEGHVIDGVLVDRSVEFIPSGDDGGQGFLDLTNDRDVALVDVTGDGWLDIVTSTTYGAGLPKTISHPRVYRNLGELGGAWLGFYYEEARTPEMTIAPNFCGVGVGDVDGNGSADLYFVDYLNTLEDRLWINDGTGFFGDESTLRMTAEMLESDFGVHAVIADMNGDGANDVVKDRALTAPIRISISYNDASNGGFFDEFETAYLGSSYHVEVGDLNNDGLQDIVIDDDGIDRYLLNQGNGTDGLADFSTLLFPPESDSFGGNIVIRDLDKDGHQDVLIADVDVDCCGCSRHMHMWRNNGDLPEITFTEETGDIPVTARTGTHDVAVFDLNGDSWLDLVIGTCSGMSVWIAEPPLSIEFAYPQGRPSFIAPGVPHELLVQLQVIGPGTLLPDSVALHTSIAGGPFTMQTLEDLGGGLFSGELPATPCGSGIDYYLSASLVEGGEYRDPPSAPAQTHVTVSATDVIVSVDGFEDDVSEWTVTSDPSLASGAWEVALPNGTSWQGTPAAPPEDAGSGGDVMAFVTENGPPGGLPTENDVDGGATTLTSPVLALDGQDAVISYQRWFYSELGDPDALVVEISVDAGSWVMVETVTTTNGAWGEHAFLVSDHVVPGDTARLRFTTADSPNDSITEAGLDEFRIERLECGGALRRGDCNDNGSFEIGDPIELLDVLFLGGSTSCADACDGDDDGALGLGDAIYVLNALFAGGDPPPAPYPDCGSDPSDDALGCSDFGSCP